MNKLVVEVHDASDLMPKDGDGFASPFVEVDFEGERQRTQTKPKDLNPQWNEKLVFNINNPRELPGKTIDVFVYNDRKSGHHKNFLGRVRISGVSVPFSEPEATIQRYPLDKRGLFSNVKGDIALRIYAVQDDHYAPPPQHEDGSGNVEFTSSGNAEPPPPVPPPLQEINTNRVDEEIRREHFGDEKMKKKKSKEKEVRTFHSIGTGAGGGGPPPPPSMAYPPPMSSGFGFETHHMKEKAPTVETSVTLLRDMSVKGDGDAFQKNCLEFHLYEPRRDRTKGQLLATAIVDLADHGVVKETISVSAPMNSKRSFRNTDQPVLFIKIQPFVKGRTSSSSGDSLSRGASLDKAGGESVSGLMNEDYAEEAEVASFTDDDVSSHSSQTISSALDTNRTLSPKKQETGEETRPHSTEGKNEKHALASKLGLERPNLIHEFMKGGSSCSSSVDLSSDPGSPVNGNASVANSPSSSSTILKAVGSETAPSPSASVLNEKAEESRTSMRSNGHERLSHEVNDKVFDGGSKITAVIQQSSKYDEKAWGIGRDCPEAAVSDDSSTEDNERKKQENRDERQHVDEEKQAQRGGESFIAHEANGKQDPLGTKENIKHVKSVRSAIDSAKNALPRNDQNAEVKETGIQGDAQNSAGVAVSLRGKERKEAKVYPRDTRSVILESKIHQLEHRIKLLEGELREAAAVEAALYSVVAEHGSSMSKVHAPARRLSRLYLHACKESSRSRRASAARSIVSGLVLVAKACGNDVPRLTYWLSNSIVLRTIISQVTGEPELLLSPGSSIDRNGAGKVKNNVSSPIKWKAPSSGKKEGMKLLNGSFDCDNPHTFMSTLEKIESWIFSRIVESIWWQTLTPHMQSVAAKELNEGVDSGSRKNYRRTSSSIDQEQSNFSLDLWKKAFRDACERLCPVRAGGHECGCLPLLGRLVMEQSVARLDVAMFNAILRESSDEIPTDPVSDPISDLKVLPIPAGKSSFGAGAQLKSAIGNWSRWLTDLFGMDDDDDSLEDVNDDDDNDERQDKSFKSFHLLNALSGLMMLPKDLLLSKSIRKEVCPAFAAPLIKRILDTFVPDEFCTDPIPGVVLEALESEDTLEVGEEAVTNVPCTGAGTVYLPPSTTSVASIIGEVGGQSQLRRSGSSVLRKSYTSDDELDELNSPLASIFIDSSRSSPVATKLSWVSKGNSQQNATRYELLRDVWMNSE